MPRTASALATASTAVFLFLILIAGHPNLSGSAQAATATFGMHIVGESPTFDAGLPVLVAGVWHQVALNLSSTLSTPITLRAILPGSGSPSPANTYEWVRYQSNDSWADVRYGTFLRAELSSDDGTHVVFGIGVDGEASPGTWTLIASSGNSTLVTQSVEVQAPRVSYGISAADFQFRVDPFTAADLSSQIGSQHLRLIDQGNVPLRLTVSFDVLRSQLSLENSGVVTHPNSESMYYLHLASGPMPPQIVRANGLANVSVLYVVPSSGSTLLVPTFEQPFGVSVQVGRSGYADGGIERKATCAGFFNTSALKVGCQLIALCTNDQHKAFDDREGLGMRLDSFSLLLQPRRNSSLEGKQLSCRAAQHLLSQIDCHDVSSFDLG